MSISEIVEEIHVSVGWATPVKEHDGVGHGLCSMGYESKVIDGLTPFLTDAAKAADVACRESEEDAGEDVPRDDGNHVVAASLASLDVAWSWIEQRRGIAPVIDLRPYRSTRRKQNPNFEVGSVRPHLFNLLEAGMVVVVVDEKV
jgi:hypothetical protein